MGESWDFPLFVLEGIDSPMRAIKSLQWLNDAGAMPPNTRTRKRQQAVVIEPGMIAHLEEGIAIAEGNHDPEWLALLTNWLCAVGGLRHRHIQLSTPQRLSASTLHSWCSQGKQAHARKGFAWSVPAEFGSGFPWARKVLEAIQSLPEDKRSSCGLVFDREGVPYPISTVQRKAQILFEKHLGDAKNITTYSWSRVGPTIGLLAGYTDVGLNALGDWTEEVKSSTVIPANYAGSKEAFSTRMKHLSRILCRWPRSRGRRPSSRQ